MALSLIMLVSLLNHSSFKGNKILISLFAIDLGASPATVGLLYAMYSVFPILLSFYAGKISDRFGFKMPVLLASLGVVVSLLLPFAWPALPALFISATFVGMCNIFYVVAVQHAVGELGEGAERVRNYGIFAVAVGVTALTGPVLTGFSIDSFGHRATFLFLAVLPAASMIALLSYRHALPRPKLVERRFARRGIGDLLSNASLRRVLVASALLEAGMELFNFLMPIYGHSLGFSASQIGIVMGAFALALMSVRAFAPALVRRSSEESVFSLSMFVAGVGCIFVPFVTSIGPLLGVAFVLGLGLGSGAPLAMVLSYNRSPEGRAGEAMGLRQTINKTMEAGMPVVFGFLSAALGFMPVYWLGALILGGGGWLMAREAQFAASRATKAD